MRKREIRHGKSLTMRWQNVENKRYLNIIVKPLLISVLLFAFFLVEEALVSRRGKGASSTTLEPFVVEKRKYPAEFNKYNYRFVSGLTF